MRWGNNEFRWVRPLQRILGIFNGERIQLGFDLIGSDVYFDPDLQTFEDSYTNEHRAKHGTIIATNNGSLNHNLWRLTTVPSTPQNNCRALPELTHLLPLGICVIDQDLIVHYWNPTLQE